MFEKHDYKSVAEKIMTIFDKKEFTNRKGEALMDSYGWDRVAKQEFGYFQNLGNKS